jgi:hypothetical protein
MTVPTPYHQASLFTTPIVSCIQIDNAEANSLLDAWGHQLGAVNRPFRQIAYALTIGDQRVAVAVSASIVSATVIDYQRKDVVELARLCADPAQRWATRPMLRIWRSVLAQRWPDWPIRAAISYSHNALHTGDIYRFDGWTRVRTDAGRSGGTSHGKPRDPLRASSRKTLWLYAYDPPQENHP